MSEAESKEKQNASITAYLQAPRRKRKNFVVLAFGDSMDADLVRAIDSFVRANYQNLSVSRPSSPSELRRQFVRNITLMVVDDNFSKREEVLDMMLALKTKRRKDNIPVLYMTRSPDDLIEGYGEKLAAFHESDEYCDYGTMDIRQVLGKVKNGIDNKNKRRSRRYTTNLDTVFFHLAKDKELRGKIVDISTHGILLHCADIERFHFGEQLRISLPIAGYLDPSLGEIMRISGRVKRVEISGNVAGIGFEYVSESQYRNLATFVSKFGLKQLVRRNG